jgi:plasmid stabilization system protein ParE
MKYTVVWRPDAERRLAEIWLAATDHQAVTDAANQIDALLRADPTNGGEARDLGVRVLTRPPITVYFEVSEPDRLVTVWSVWSSQSA